MLTHPPHPSIQILDLGITSQYYFVLQRHLPVLLCTTKLAQSTSQYRFVLQSLLQALPKLLVLQSLQKALPNTTSYHNVCTKYFPVWHGSERNPKWLYSETDLTCLRFSRVESYFILQSLDKGLPSTILYYKPCKVLPNTTLNFGLPKSILY